MNTLEEIVKRWEYIQGGFYYIDSTNACNEKDLTSLSRHELSAFVNALPNAEIKDNIISMLKLERNIGDAQGMPRSFEAMLECDNEYLQREPSTPLNSEFGSVAIALLYRDIAAMLNAQESISGQMLQAITQKTGRTPILS